MNLNFANRPVERPSQQLKQGTLPRAIRPNNAYDLTTTNLERHITKRIRWRMPNSAIKHFENHIKRSPVQLISLAQTSHTNSDVFHNYQSKLPSIGLSLRNIL